MQIEIKEVINRSQLKKFIYLPEKIHKTHLNWIPPIYMDEFTFFDKNKNKSFKYCDTILALAYKNNEPVGRIMGIIHHKYNKTHNENDARFSFIETYNDFEVYEALIQFVEKWAKNKGCNNLVGPLGFSDKDPQGFMIEGFDKPVVIASNANFEFMPNFIEKMGYSKKVDLVVYNVPIPKQLPKFYETIYQRVLSNKKNIKLIEFKNKLQLRKYIKPVLELLNDTFQDIYAFTPFEEQEMRDYANRYIMILDPEFVKVIENENGELIAFIIGMPEISEGVKKARGKMLPFGIFKVWKAQRQTKMLTLLLGGIKSEYRGQGLDVVLGANMLKSAIKHDFKFLDSHLELETNLAMRSEMERMNGQIYKRFRIFQKNLK